MMDRVWTNVPRHTRRLGRGNREARSEEKARRGLHIIPGIPSLASTRAKTFFVCPREREPMPIVMIRSGQNPLSAIRNGTGLPFQCCFRIRKSCLGEGGGEKKHLQIRAATRVIRKERPEMGGRRRASIAKLMRSAIAQCRGKVYSLGASEALCSGRGVYHPSCAPSPPVYSVSPLVSPPD